MGQKSQGESQDLAPEAEITMGRLSQQRGGDEWGAWWRRQQSHCNGVRLCVCVTQRQCVPFKTITSHIICLLFMFVFLLPVNVIYCLISLTKQWRWGWRMVKERCCNLWESIWTSQWFLLWAMFPYGFGFLWFGIGDVTETAGCEKINAASHMLMGANKYNHVLPVLWELHCLPSIFCAQA